MNSKNNIKVSVIIPVYNADLYLEECLKSVENQTLKDIEIICINDNSRDKSLKILHAHAKKDKRIKVIELKTTGGQSHARNEGIKAAAGEYIGFADADDFADENMFGKMYCEASKNKADIAMCRAKVFDDKVKNYKDDDYFELKCFDENQVKKVFSHQDTKNFLMQINVSLWNKLYKRSFLEEIGVHFREGYIYEDLPYFFETFTKAGRAVFVDDYLYSYRINNQNSTMTRTDKNVKDRIDMMSLTYDILKKQTYYKELKSEFISWILHDIYYRFLIIDSRYQKEYFFRMQKFFRTIDIADIDESLLKSPYYPHFCEIRNRNYEEVLKYFFNKETIGEAYIKRAKEVYLQKYNNLQTKYQNLEKLEEENLKKRYDLEALQDKILEEEKERWTEFEQQKASHNTDLEHAKELIDAEWEKIKEERAKNQQELSKAWEQFETETKAREAEIDDLQQKILEDEKNNWAEINKEKAAFEKSKQEQQAEIDETWKAFEKAKEEQQIKLEKAWEKFKADTQKREAELNELQQKILEDEKIRWKEYETKVNEFEKECIARSAEIEKNKLLAEKNIEQYLNSEEKQLQRQKNLSKLAIEKTKNRLSNQYIESVAEEKANLAKKMSEKLEENQQYFNDLLENQLKLQQENYERIAKNHQIQSEEQTDENEEKVQTMHKPKVSVILPVYNVAPYLRQSLDSVVNQTLTDIEIICVDDGSTDESGKILDEYKEKDSRIKVIHKKNAGTGAARNDGLRIATGECIGFVDPDDWILPNMYERLYALLWEKDLDIVMFTPDVYNDKTKKHEGFLYFQNSNFPDFLDNKIFNKDDISPFSYPMCVWNKLYRKSLFDENNIEFAEGLDFEDHKVIFKSLFTAKRIYFIREKLYVYRHSREGSILSDNDTRMFDHIKIYDIVENILKETGNWEKFHLDFLRYKVHNILYYYTMIKPQYKEEYYDKMVKSLRSTKMSEEEINILSKDYPDLKPIMEKNFFSKIKKAVKKITKKKEKK